MIIFTVLVACLSVCLALEDKAWEAYKLQYKKVYTSETEELSRYLTWKENVDGIELHNSFYGDSYQQGEIICVLISCVSDSYTRSFLRG